MKRGTARIETDEAYVVMHQPDCHFYIENLDRLEVFVLDEADRMLDMGFIHASEG
jgi:hypothetical protein